MKRLSITEIQRNIGILSEALIRGEPVIITRNGRDLGQFVAIKRELSTSKKKVKSSKPFSVTPEAAADTDTESNDYYSPAAMAERLRKRAEETKEKE